MDYDESLHLAWVDAAMVLAYDFAEAYCNLQCVNDSDNLHALNTARRALRTHLHNKPASMDESTEGKLRKERDSARNLAVRWLRKFQTEMLPTPEMLEETHALIKEVRATVNGSPVEHIGEKAQQS